MLDPRAKWIWINSDPQKCEYAFFSDKFNFYGERATFTVAAETDYILYVNGRLASFGQFAGYPFEKYFDEIDITYLCKQGVNSVELTVRYEGVSCATHIDDGAGVIFSLDIDGKNILYSRENTLGGYDNRYVQHAPRRISPQLGHTSDMACGKAIADNQCVEVSKTYNIKPRPVKKTVKGEFIEGKPLSIEGHKIFDLGREECGYVSLKIKTSAPATVKVAYGEHIADGCVRYIIDNRDFSVNFETDGGTREFTQYFLRVAARYLEVFAPDDAEILSIGVIPYLYPQIEKPFPLDGLDKRIYDTCMRTLRLCMNNHYEDCPWREQGLYAMDSRNQMLAGYYAFGEYDYAEKNLLLLAKGMDENGLLPLCAPSSQVHPIPSFSLAYLWSVDEFETCSGRLVDPFVFEAVGKIMNAFGKRLDESENGLIAEFEPPYWNFFEWLWGTGSYNINPEENSSLLNLMYLAAFEKYKSVCARHGTEPKYPLCGHEKFKETIRATFMMSDGTYRVKCPKDAVSDTEYIPCDTDKTSALANSFAILSGICKDGEAERLAERIKQADVPAATLSMKGFFYDAIYMADKQNAEYIISDICKDYSHMLDRGATTFWETIIGAEDFNYAGSLCHGWNALPIYYIRKFNK